MAGVTPALTATNTAYVELFDLDSLARGANELRAWTGRTLARPMQTHSAFLPFRSREESFSRSIPTMGYSPVMSPCCREPLTSCRWIQLFSTNFGSRSRAIQGTAGNGTHTVSVYADGSLTPFRFSCHRWNRGDLSCTEPSSTNFTTALATNYLSLGCPSSLAMGAIDIDYFGYKQGVFVPAVFNAAPSWAL